MTPRTAKDAAEYRDWQARSALAAEVMRNKAAREAAALKPKRSYKRRPKPLPPRSEPIKRPTAAQRRLAAKLLPHVCLESTVDRDQHALGVARMILSMGVKR